MNTKLHLVVAVAAVLLTASASAQPYDVLVYSPFPSAVLTVQYTGPALTLDVVSEAAWQLMTSAEFANYDMIYFGGLDTVGSPVGTAYATLNNTKTTWSPAVSGRVIFNTVHISTAVHQRSEGAQLLTDAITWLLAGGGTSLYIGADHGGSLGGGFLSELGVSLCNIGCNTANNTVTVVDPTHPVTMNSTTMGLSNWAQSTHGSVATMPANWVTLCEDAALNKLMVAREGPTCTIITPTPFAFEGGDVDVTFEATDTSVGTIDLAFDYSTDFGSTYQAAGASGVSALPNPSLGQPIPVMGTFTWDSVGDGVGILAPPPVPTFFRITVTGPLSASACEVIFQTDNRTLCPTAPYECGDCDGDGFVTIMDAFRVARLSLGMAVETVQGQPLWNACNIIGPYWPDATSELTVLDSLAIASGTVGLRHLNCCAP